MGEKLKNWLIQWDNYLIQNGLWFFSADNYGWSFLDYFDSQGNGENKNVGFTLFPLKFWNHLGFWHSPDFHGEIKRTFVGLGFFSIFWDS